ncbi:hypothetical protein HUJ04_007421, partial [Dendroctonus ponderosae]
LDNINTSPRKRRDNDKDGVTTEYATQVLGTTLDNGRLYAHLLTKTSRVVYDHDSQTKSYDPQNHKNQWNLDEHQIVNKNFIRNTDYISPDSPQAVYVFPTSTVNSYHSPSSLQNIDPEILNEAQSNNAPLSFEGQNKQIIRPQGLQVMKVNAQKDFTHENLIIHNDNPADLAFNPSKVKGWDNLPTYTVRNEFSPSGFSYLGNLPESEVRTERSRFTTQSDRKARLLFKAGLVKPNPKDLQTVTYTGFADFTTTVADTVIVFTPHTNEPLQNTAQVTKIAVEPTIKPTNTFKSSLATKKVENTPVTEKYYPAFLTTEENPTTTLPTTTESDEEDPEEVGNTSGPNTMIINKEDRDGKERTPDEPIDFAAKFSVLANEQKQDGAPVSFTPDIIQPSETQPVLLSTPSDEDIAKILASLQAQAMSATQPLESAKPSTLFFDDEQESTSEVTTPTIKSIGGATTIFFEDDDFSFEPSTTQSAAVATTSAIEAIPIQTTSEKPSTTSEIPETTTTNEETTTEEIEMTTEAVTAPQILQNEIESAVSESVPAECTEGVKMVPTTAYKTLTYLTTFYIPSEETTSTSIKSQVVVSSELSSATLPCSDNEIQPTTVLETTTEATQVPVTEPTFTATTTTSEPLLTATEQEEMQTTTLTNELSDEDEDDAFSTQPHEITTEMRHVTESEPDTTESSTDEDDEIELIFKTLYTTYTYLTTYFQDSTSSVASRIVVTTNVITSTLDPANDASDPALAGLLREDEKIVPSRTVSFDDLAGIQSTSGAANAFPSDHSEVENNQDEYNPGIATPALDEKHLQTVNGVKTFYTTYTYFTTIFVDGETEISSRTEVYTNYVTPTAVSEGSADILATALAGDGTDDDDKDSLEYRLRNLKLNVANNYSSINRQKVNSIEAKRSENDVINNVIPSKTQKGDGYITLTHRGNKVKSDNSIVDLSDYETISTMVTDVRSSTSKGDERIIDTLDKRNILLDDQIVSESNNESEILPSPPTLLLQTSYTTFTYFTTMYHGTTSSDIASRLETVTNVVTTTITPTQTLNTEDVNLPVTYFTTFTYWTTLYKDGQTKITSREETVSNVVTPGFKATEAPEAIIPLMTTKLDEGQVIQPTPTVEGSVRPTETPDVIIPSTVGEDELTTFYTTYTYYTTSYLGDETVLNSRLETVTNVLNKTDEADDSQQGRAIKSGGSNQVDSVDPTKADIKPTGLLSTIVNTVDNNGTSTIFSTDVFGTYIDGRYAKVLESKSSVLPVNITPSSVVEESLKPTGVVSINQGKIVDADGISTLLYTTQAIGTYIDNLYSQVIESTSSLAVDQEKKAALGSDLPVAHRTGLVRLIEGSIVQNQTTTLYESKVLGTIIDGRYAQIIESTSSFILPTISPSAVVTDIVPTATKHLGDQAVISPSPVVLEGSLTETQTDSEETTTEPSNDEDDEEDGRGKSRLSFQSKAAKNKFTPAIRPFASRQRPTFAPKRNKAGATTAATITRSDFTPTVTAVPASKIRFGGGRRGSSSVNQAIQPTASGSRRFSRPKATSSSRRSSASQVKATSSGFKRTGPSRSSLGGANIRPSSLFGGNSRFRIRPTAASGLSRSSSSKIITETPPDSENDLTTSITDNPTDSSGEAGDTTLPLQTSTESIRRTNPLLRFKRPPVSRANPSVRTTSKPAVRNTNSFKSNRATSTTSRPRTTPARPNALLNRPRAGGLFPRRNLFTTTTTAAPEEELDEEVLDEEGEEGDDDDTDYEGSQRHTQTEAAPTTPKATPRPNGIQIKPFRRRSKRQATYSRFRRPTGRTTAAPSTSPTPEVVAEPSSQRTPSFRNRYQSNQYRSGKSQLSTQPQTTTAAPVTQRKRISPSKPQTSRAQFTLKGKDTINSRNSGLQARTTNRRTTTSAPKPNRKFRNGYSTEASVRRTTASPRRVAKGRSTSSRRVYEQKIDDNFVVPKFDGTITVTYKIPTEVTIPVVNGKITEYKNIVTAKLSTEVLAPNQYSTTLNHLGKEVKALLTENSSVNNNGATLVTQFLLSESPTTTVIFTPTQIRGRKTSFSHVIPSTVYQVEEVVNTIQPALANQAPLANILLSQLLLGGGVPANPLLGLQNNPGVPATPTTEFNTRTTTYVTTVTSTLQTVIPLTFRGKEILTTISETSTQVVTATEFLTDTVVVTPTLPVFASSPQLNTLLLPLLQQQLQQQQQQQQQQQANQALLPQIAQVPANVFNLNEPPHQQLLVNDELEESNIADNDEIQSPQSTEVTAAPKRKPKKNKRKPAKVEPPKETSVITLYVSGRTPGDFTTVLSTVTVGENARKRRYAAETPVRPSKIVGEDLVSSTQEYFDRYVEPATKEINIDASDVGSKETESLESIIGDVPKHLKTKTAGYFATKPSKATMKYSIKYVKASDGKVLKKANLDDLSNHLAPDNAKVETSILKPGGNFSDTDGDTPTNKFNRVSKNIGKSNNDFFVHNYDKGNLYIELSNRNKRDLDSVNGNGTKNGRRVVKKLIRKQLVNATEKNAGRSIENLTEPISNRKRRRKVKIKKRKLLPPPKEVVDSNYLRGLEEHGQEATKPRRKLVITRKRILPNKNKTNIIEPTSVAETIPTTMMMENSKFDIQIEKNQIEKHFRESRLGKGNQFLNVNSDAALGEDATEENLIDVENSTESQEFINNNDEKEDEINEEDDDGDYDDEYYDDDDEGFESDEDDDYEEEYTDDEGKNDEETTEESLSQSETTTEENQMVSVNSENPQTNNTDPDSQSLPEYEPFFPELTETTDVPVLLLKTTVVTNVEFETKTITTTRLRTYTFVVTRLAGDEEIITSTTEIKPQIKTTTVTESSTLFTTLTLLDLDSMDKTDVQPTFLPTLEYNPSSLSNMEDNPDFREEPRNLATRIMSNGVEVIVAGDKSTYPGDKDFKRVLPSSQRHITLKPSTLTDHMLLVLPQETSNVESLSTALDPNQFVVKTCLTTFTYLTTYLEKGSTTVSSHEQVVSNVATEERMNTGKILPTPAVGITLTQYPTLSVGVFHTTYTYLNTILDGEQPLVISSQHVVANTVTAPDDYLSLLKPSEVQRPVKDTNTYISTINLEKTLYEGEKQSVISTQDVVTQVVITESVPPKARPVMTSYIALDMIQEAPKVVPTTTDVTKTYSVTYTYFNTVLESGKPVVYTNVSTESEVVTEKVLMHPKKTTSKTVTNATRVESPSKQVNSKVSALKFDILATRIYFTTFTYFTTLLKENDPQQTTIINSRTKVIQNVITETLAPSLFDPQYLASLSEDLKVGSGSIQKLATLVDGQKMEITVHANENHNEINPTNVLPIKKTQMPSIESTSKQSSVTSSASLEGSFGSSKPNIITGSTIVFIDDDPFANLIPTPSLNTDSTKIDIIKSSSIVKNNLGSLLASEVVKETTVDVVTSKVKRPGNKNKNKNKNKVNTTKPSTATQSSSSISEKNVKKNDKNKKVIAPAKATLTKQPEAPAGDLLGLGSININTLQALTPVLSAMAGYINKNLKSNRRNDVNSTVDRVETPIYAANSQNKQDTQSKNHVAPAIDVQNRSPVYIPVGGVVGDDFEIAESQNIATFEWNDSPIQPQALGPLQHEAPLLGNSGISISPGDVITANSDVIVGKPGRVGPRLPATIPLHHESVNEVPVGMKPPPLPEKQNNWRSKNNNAERRPQIPLIVDQVPAQTNIIHAPNQDDYVGPPPPVRENKDKFRGEKRKHIPLIPQRRPEQSYKPNGYEDHNQHPTDNQFNHYNMQGVPQNNNGFRENGIAQNSDQINFASKYAPQYSGEQHNPAGVVGNFHNSGPGGQHLQEAISNNYQKEAQKQSYPIYAANQKPLIVTSIPIVLPEVVERSTGQPLLVQLQPSQVAFVNIPVNRTTALIYGGSTETHHNGQYFDDPSPYPEPEFNPIEGFKKGIPQFASIYHDTPQLNQVNQKQVSGVIKVGSHIDHSINAEPDTSSNEKIPIKIAPSRLNDPPQYEGGFNVNVPLSYGMSEQHGDTNAHIINHEGGKIAVQANNIPFVVFNNSYSKHPNQYSLYPNSADLTGTTQRPNLQNRPAYADAPGVSHEQALRPSTANYGHGQKSENFNHEPSDNLPASDLSVALRPPQNPNIYPDNSKPNRPIRFNKPKYNYPPKRNMHRPRPNRPQVQISEFMTPPPSIKQHISNRPPFRQSPIEGNGHIPIPLVENQEFKPPNQVSGFDSNPPPLENLQPNSDEVFPIFDPNKGQSSFNVDFHSNKRPSANNYHQENLRPDAEKDDLFSDDHLDDDFPNEDGEVVQESNARPLRPGELPIEVLRKGQPTTTEYALNMVRFPDSLQNNTQIRFPYSKYPRPELVQQTLFKGQEIPISPAEVPFDFGNRKPPHPARPPSTGYRITTFKPTFNFNTYSSNPQTQTEENRLDFNRKPIESTQTTTQANRGQPRINMTSSGGSSSTQRPILIFIDENGQQNGFFRKPTVKNDRPRVTSLPIDPQTSTTIATTRKPKKPETQTEKPFDASKYPAKQQTNEINIPIVDDDKTKNPVMGGPTRPSILLNSGENFGVDLTQQINDMEVLQPPPLLEEVPKIPSVSMQPPKIDISSPGHDIVRVPHIKTKSPTDQEGNANTIKPFVPEPSEEMVPPAPDIRPDSAVPTTEVVLGMNPPPLVSTHRPLISSERPIVHESNNEFSMQVDIPKDPHTTLKTYERPKTRMPPFRKPPGYRRTSTTTPTSYTSSTSTKRTTPQENFKTRTSTTSRPLNVGFSGVFSKENNSENGGRQQSKIPSTSSTISPTPTVKNTPSMEVIVGQPNFNQNKENNRLKDNKNTSSENQAQGSSREPSSTTEATPELPITVPQDLNDIITKPIHHAGNEVKIVDEPKKSIATSSLIEKSAVLPTRYITHTKTHTVTITKTTVVKTLGGPPSTLTLLVTKTEKSYIVDTVTEFHTLVKPTSIIETVTTTIQKENSLYPSDAFQSSYPIGQVKATSVVSNVGKPTIVPPNEHSPHVFSSEENHGFDDDESDDDDSLEDFIIKDTDEDHSQGAQEESYNSNESIFVVMTDKNKGTIIKMPPQIPEPNSNDHPQRDEIRENEVNDILLGGILTANQPVNVPGLFGENNKEKCTPECKPSRNELCQKVEGMMRCVCRPGFARMFPDRPCNPTYTYSMNVTIEKIGKLPVRYTDRLSMENSTEFMRMSRRVHEALDRMVMQSDLRDIFHGVHVTSFYPTQNRNGVISKFYLQLSDNIDEIRMEDILKKYLRNSNYSIGGTDVIASTHTAGHINVQDFNECENPKFHDCSDNSQCFNLRGTYTCSCKEGYSDLSENMLYPGRICSAEQVGCEKCNYHGMCYSRGSEEVLCECFHWYAGEFCQINLKVLLIALVTLGTILFVLLLVCIILTCVKKKPQKSRVSGTIGFLPQRGSNQAKAVKMDRRAMIEDTSSEDSRSETNSVPPYVQQKQPKLKPPPPKGALKKVSKVSMTSVEHSEPGIIFPDQKDRSLTVMIPRAKYHPAAHTSPLMNYTTFDARKPSVPSVTPEAKLLSYLDAGPGPSRTESKRKYSNAISEQFIEEQPNSRKTSGALISAGFEVSATVVNNMGTLGTTCGTEADRSENATLIQKISADLLSRADTSSQFNTLRKSLVTVSESRSYDETTIPPPMKSFTRSEYDTKSFKSLNQNDEANTMAERDLGSTFLLPHTHLYKPDRGSDISGFESL